MSLVKIDERRDYELYVKNVVAKMTVSNKQKGIIRKISMQCFDDGVKYNQKMLEVEV